MSEAEPGRDEALRLARVSTHLLVLMPLRLGLGVAGLAAASLVGRPAVAAFAFALGALGAAIALGADPRYSRDLLDDVPPLPAGARFASRIEIAAAGIFPSTVGVVVLTVVALFFNAALAGFLAGVLAGMAVAGFAAWVTLDSIERRTGTRLYFERRPGKRAFAGPR